MCTSYTVPISVFTSDFKIDVGGLSSLLIGVGGCDVKLENEVSLTDIFSKIISSVVNKIV